MAKTLRKISTKEYITIIDGDIHTGAIPRLVNDEATLPQLVSYFKNYYDIVLDVSDIELVKLNITIVD